MASISSSGPDQTCPDEGFDELADNFAASFSVTNSSNDTNRPQVCPVQDEILSNQSGQLFSSFFKPKRYFAEVKLITGNVHMSSTRDMMQQSNMDS